MACLILRALMRFGPICAVSVNFVGIGALTTVSLGPECLELLTLGTVLLCTWLLNNVQLLIVYFDFIDKTCAVLFFFIIAAIAVT